MLKSGEADFIVHDNPKLSGDFSAVELGYENLVHVRSKSGLNSGSINNESDSPPFLDHDVDDMTTYHFFAMQDKRDIDIKRSFYDDIYGIIDGVRLGFGEAIVSKHLIENDDRLEIIAHENRVTSPVILYHQKNRYLSELQKEVIRLLIENTSQYLK